MEFRYLSKITNIPVYAEKANRVFDNMHDLKSNDGLYPIFLNPATGNSIGSQVCEKQVDRTCPRARAVTASF